MKEQKKAHYYSWSKNGTRPTFFDNLEDTYSELSASFRLKEMVFEAEIFEEIAGEIKEIRESLETSWNNSPNRDHAEK